MAWPTRRLAAVHTHLHPVPASAEPHEPHLTECRGGGAELLDDLAMQEFVRTGYVMFNLDLPTGYNEGIVQRLGKAIEKHGNPGNNMLPMVPELKTMLNHPKVDGALQSILGADYYVHLHRHPHFIDRIDEGQPGKVHHLHKDSMVNSRFPADARRRHHRTRMCMLIYFPQDTPLELGPTAILPRSQYLLHQPDRDEPTVPYEEEEAMPLAGPAGTVGIIHYDMLHTSTNKTLEQPRHMIKFLFSRMSEPDSGPSWNSQGLPWQPSDNAQEPLWRAIWDWHCGQPSKPSWTAGIAGLPADADMLAEQLHGDNEMEAVRSAYGLGISCGEAGQSALLQTLCELAPESDEDQEVVGEKKLTVEQSSNFFASDPPSQAGYGLVEAGAAAVPALIELASSTQQHARVRARAIDVLGDIGPQAVAALPTLVAALNDPAPDCKRRAAEALGTVGCGSDTAAAQGLCLPLARLLREDSSQQIRRSAAYSLARLGPAVGANSAAGNSGSDENDINIEGVVVEALREGLSDGYHYVRGFCALALERVGTPRAIKAVLAHLQTVRFDAD